MARFALRSLAALVASASVLLALGSGARAEPGAGVHLENLVPERTLGFLSLEDVGGWGAKFKATAISKMFAEPEMQAFIKPIQEDLERLGKEQAAGGPGLGGMKLPPMFFKVMEQLQGLSGQVAVALVDWVDQHGPVVAASLDFGTHLQDFVAFLKRMGADAAKDGAPITSEEKDGRTWWTIGGGGGGGPTFTATSVGTAILLSTDASWLQAAVASNGAAIASPLGAAASFKGSKASAGGDGLMVFVHANVPAILEKANLRGDGKRVADALGADTIRSASYGIAFKGDGFVESIVLDAPKADHGIIPLLVTKPVSHTALETAPSTAFYFAESSVNLSTMVPKVRAIVEKIDAQGLQEMDRALSKAREALGVDIETQLLAGLADEFSVYAAVPETGGLYPEVCLSMKVKDPAAYEALVEKSVQGIAGAVSENERVTVSQRTIEYHGKRLHVVDLVSKRRDMVPFTPTWAILGDRLVVTLVPHALKEIVLRTELGNPSGGLKAQEDVQSLLRTAPEGTGGWVYVDLQAAINLLYDTGVPALQTFVKPNKMNSPVRFDFAQLPPARVMRPYFRSLAEFVVGDDAGVRVQIRGPLPMMLPMIAMSAILPMVMMGRMGRQRAHFEAVAPVEVVPHESGGADYSMLEVNAAVRLYFSDNGKLPATLDDLTKPNPKTDRPYLEKLPKDRWGRDFGYDKTGDGGDDYSVKSAGADGVFGTADDVVFPRRMR